MEGHGLGVGSHETSSEKSIYKVGCWIEAKEGDVVTFTPGRVSVSFQMWQNKEGRKDSMTVWREMIATRVAQESPAAGEVSDFYLAVQDVSTKPVRLCTTADAPNKRRLMIMTAGVPQSRTVSEAPNGIDVTLQPREVVFLRLFPERDMQRPVIHSRGPLDAAAVRKIPTMTMLADLEITNAPGGAWTGMLITADTRAGIGAEAPQNQKAQ